MTNFARISIVAVVLALASAAPAAAHTSATCLLDNGQARCLGTIDDHTVSTAPQPASLAISGGRATLVIYEVPLISIFSPGIAVRGDLACADMAAAVVCQGPGTADRQGISISTSGSTGGGVAVIRLTDRPTLAA